MTPPMQIYRQADELLGRERLAHDQGHANNTCTRRRARTRARASRRGAGPSRAARSASAGGWPSNYRAVFSRACLRYIKRTAIYAQPRPGLTSSTGQGAARSCRRRSPGRHHQHHHAIRRWRSHNRPPPPFNRPPSTHASRPKESRNLCCVDGVDPTRRHKLKGEVKLGV